MRILLYSSFTVLLADFTCCNSFCFALLYIELKCATVVLNSIHDPISETQISVT